MADYPRACSRCGVVKPEADFGAGRSKKSGHKSHCRACERADYASRKDELQARRDAVREAAWQARLKKLEDVHREKVAAAKREHEAGVARQEKLLREIGYYSQRGQ
jgi:predicted  nucleic acid-binding Zn-ribbon protein